jgi:thiamine-monophosphate kinase
MRRAGIGALVDQPWVPEPRLAEGRALASAGLVHAMLDISDGLAGDLRHLVEASGVGAVVEQDRLPVSEAATAVAVALSLDVVELALSGGQDYELLVALPEDPVERAREAVLPTPLHVVGRATPASQGVRLRRPDGSETELLPTAWRHF